MANRIQLRRGGAQEWANSNPTLAQGELGIELDTGRFKIGDGVSAWNTLRYERPVESTSNTANTLFSVMLMVTFLLALITSTLIGNASTASRLASSRQIQLSNEVTASGVFDGSANLNLSTELALVSTLPHYDGTATPTGVYNKVTVDAKGRIVNAQDFTASNNGTLADYGLDGTTEGQSAQAYDLDLVAISGLTTTGLISRTASNTMATRTITGTAQRISVNEGAGISGNPTIDLITTAVQAGNYNTESLTSVSAAGSNSEPYGTQTVNATKFTVDAYGRLTSATNVPIATATEGSKYPNYDAGTTYSRYDIIQNASKVYQALGTIAAGAGAPTHSSGDTGSWRYLAAEATEQKGLASFAQEDFDVDANGHVTIAAAGVDNTQLQNNKLIFTDGSAVENFELDNELTTSTANTGFNRLNFVKINDTSGNLLFGANNTGDSGAGEIDVNVRSYFSDPDITLDGASAQALDKSGDGNLTFSLTQNSSSARNLTVQSTNSGSGTSTVTITAEDVVDIDASDANGKVHVENARFQGDYIGSTGTLNLDPGDDRAVTGLVRVWGDLQVDGVTTTVNSTTLQVDDVIMTLGGDTAPSSDDNKDRGVEFRYYDSQARLGFYGWDTNYTDLAGHEGGFTFLHAATNTSEVFSGTASGITAGNVKLTTGTASSSNTTGDLVVAGGVGITGAVNIGGLLDVDGTFRANSTSRFDDNIVFQGASKTLELKNGSGTTKTTFHTTTGNAEIGGILTVTGVVDANSDVTIAGNIHSESTNDITVAKNGSTGVWEIQSNDYGSLRVDGGAYVAGDALIDGTLHVNGAIEVKDSATEAESRLNWLRVRYRGRFGDSYQATPSYASHNTSTLRAHGGAGIERTLHVGGTGSGEGLFVGKRYSGDTVKFSVLGASGNTDIQGTLDVAGASEFNGTVDVDADFAVRNGTTDKFFVDNVTGNTNIEGTLTADGHTELNSTLNVDNNTTLGAQLTVTGNSEFNGTVDVDANFAVRSGSTDKFTVASSSGNVATDGTLDVAGATGIDGNFDVGTNKFTVAVASGNTVVAGTLRVDGQIDINDSVIIDEANEIFSIRNGSAVEKFGVDTDNGNTNIIGTLTVGDATQINNTLGVSNVTTITRNTQQTLTGSYAADGAFRLTGGAGIGKNLAVGGAARIYGATELTGALDLNNSADISGALVTHDNVTITADNKEFAIQNGSAVDKFTVDTDNGNTDIRGTLAVGGDLTAESDLTITGNLTVNGTTTTVNSTVTTIDDPIITVGGDTAPSSNDGKDRGVEFRYYDGSAKIGFFGFDRSTSQFAFLTSATNNAEVLSGTDGPLRAGSLNLTGSGTALDVDANANIDGTLTVDGQIISQVSSGPALVIPTTDKINNLNADLLDGATTATANTASTVVLRDGSGNFAAGTITAALTGNASTATTLETARNIAVAGVVSGTVSFNGSADVSINTTFVDADITALAAMSGTGYVVRTAANTYAQRTLQVTASSGITLTNADGVSGNTTINVASTASNSANNLVLRDASGNFAAGTITATLTGNVTGNVTGTVSDISNHDTGDLTEGSNLYYTDERVDDRVNALIVAGTGITKVYDDSAGTYTLSVTQADVNTDTITEGSTNLFTTAARTRTHFTYGNGIALAGSGELSVTQSQINTDNVTEGSTNIFFTNARSDARFDTKLAAASTTNLSEGMNLYYTNARADARADLKVAAATGANLSLANKTTTDLAEGTNQYYTEARVQTKLDNAFEQLRAMLNNLATSTTLTLNLSGDPTLAQLLLLPSAMVVAVDSLLELPLLRLVAQVLH